MTNLPSQRLRAEALLGEAIRRLRVLISAAAALARLELHGYLTCSTMGIYTRTMQSPPADDD